MANDIQPKPEPRFQTSFEWHRGVKCKVTRTSDKIGKLARVGSAFKALGAAAVGYPAILVPGVPAKPLRNYAKRTLSEDVMGGERRTLPQEDQNKYHKEKEVYEPDPKGQPDPKYNPKDRASLTARVEERKNELLHHDGNYYLLDHKRSSFIFIPGGDYAKICSIKLWANESGNAFHGNMLDRAAKVYMLAYPVLKDNKTKYNMIVINPHNHQIRGYKKPRSPLKPKGADTTSAFTGDLIKPKNDKWWEEIDAIYDKKYDEKGVHEKAFPEGGPHPLLDKDDSVNGNSSSTSSQSDDNDS